MKHYYSKESAHGSESSMGFANDNVVKVFKSKKERDNYVSNSRNISCEPIKRNEVTNHARNWHMTQNCYIEPRPFQSEFWGINDWDSDESIGCIGTIEVCCNNEERFYK
jgi:hypothetical protein